MNHNDIGAVIGRQMAEAMAWAVEAPLMGAKMRELSPDEQKAMDESERLLAQADRLEERVGELRDRAYAMRPRNLYPVEQKAELDRMWREDPEAAAASVTAALFSGNLEAARLPAGETVRISFVNE